MTGRHQLGINWEVARGCDGCVLFRCQIYQDAGPGLRCLAAFERKILKAKWRIGRAGGCIDVASGRLWFDIVAVLLGSLVYWRGQAGYGLGLGGSPWLSCLLARTSRVRVRIRRFSLVILFIGEDTQPTVHAYGSDTCLGYLVYWPGQAGTLDAMHRSL